MYTYRKKKRHLIINVREKHHSKQSLVTWYISRKKTSKEKKICSFQISNAILPQHLHVHNYHCLIGSKLDNPYNIGTSLDYTMYPAFHIICVFQSCNVKRFFLI